jgi:hypothetical protein
VNVRLDGSGSQLSAYQPNVRYGCLYLRGHCWTAIGRVDATGALCLYRKTSDWVDEILVRVVLVGNEDLVIVEIFHNLENKLHGKR